MRRFLAYSDFATVPLAIAGALAVAASGPPFYAIYAFSCMGVGALAWTLIEYGVHRVLHMRRFPVLRRFHMRHHQHPAEPTGGTFWSTLIILALLLAATCWPSTAPAIAGLLAGYLWFLVLHHLMHHDVQLGFAAHDGLDLALVPDCLRRAHALHHHVGSERMFGVSTTLWDRLFRTAA